MLESIVFGYNSVAGVSRYSRNFVQIQEYIWRSNVKIFRIWKSKMTDNTILKNVIAPHFNEMSLGFGSPGFHYCSNLLLQNFIKSDDISLEYVDIMIIKMAIVRILNFQSLKIFTLTRPSLLLIIFVFIKNFTKIRQFAAELAQTDVFQYYACPPFWI